MAFDEASAFVLTYGTSIYALKDRGISSPAKHCWCWAPPAVSASPRSRSARPWARASSLPRPRRRRSLSPKPGADEGIVYPRAVRQAGAKKLADILKNSCGDGANVIYDAVGGDYAEAALRAIAWEGRFLVVGFPAGIPIRST